MTGNGIADLVTGCFEGGLYVIAGKKGGGYKAPAALLDKAGKILRIGQYWDDEARKWTGVKSSKYASVLGISGTPVDWDSDGDLDLMLGGYDGRIYVRINEGSVEKPAYATESILVMADGAPLAVPGRSAMPVAVDWDGDGRFDIVTGSGKGGAFWFRNLGKAGKPAFAGIQTLVAAGAPGANDIETGLRTQVHVADYDADGDLDLLIGDYHYTRSKDAKGRGTMHGYVWLVRRKGSLQGGN